MSKVDWSLAPEDATHFRHDSRCYSTGGIQYYRLLDEQWFYWGEALGFGWKSCDRPCGPVIKLSSAPDKAKWSGPEDGLPPINARIYMHLDDSDEWILGTVIAHVTLEDGDVAVAHNGKDVFNGYASDFRAIWTPESRESDRRETAIRELMDIAQVDCRVTAARLVDAGFKREVV